MTIGKGKRLKTTPTKQNKSTSVHPPTPIHRPTHHHLPNSHLHDVRFWSAPRPARALRQHAARLLPTHAHDFLSRSGGSGGGSGLAGPAPATYDVVNRGPQRFPSLRVDCPAPPRRKVYYEATLRSGGCLQIGWVAPAFAPDAAYMGVGDDQFSWVSCL